VNALLLPCFTRLAVLPFSSGGVALASTSSAASLGAGVLFLSSLRDGSGFSGNESLVMMKPSLQRSWVQISAGKATSRLPAVVEPGVVVPRSLFGEDDIAKLAQQAFVAARKAEKEEQGRADENISSSEAQAKVEDFSSPSPLVAPDSANSRTSNGTSRQRRGLSQDPAIKPPQRQRRLLTRLASRFLMRM
jgi:hypothetical protein